jgi:hypothetical protein
VLVLREDDSIGLFIETERGRIRRKDMSPMGDKVSPTYPVTLTAIELHRPL